jgi:hypothetical protein
MNSIFDDPPAKPVVPVSQDQQVEAFVPPPVTDHVAALVDPLAAMVAAVPEIPGRMAFGAERIQQVRDGQSALTCEERLYLLETLPGFAECDRTEIELRQLQDSDIMEVAYWTWDECDRNALTKMAEEAKSQTEKESS